MSDSQQLQWHYTELNDHDFQIGGRTLFFAVLLFSILLLLLLVLVYARWILQWRHVHVQNTHAPPQNAPGLSPEAIRAIPVVLFNSSPGTPSGAENECCICLGVIEDGDKVKVLAGCGHCFHSCCVDKWLTGQASCPLCRAPVTGQSELRLDVDIE